MVHLILLSAARMKVSNAKVKQFMKSSRWKTGSSKAVILVQAHVHRSVVECNNNC